MMNSVSFRGGETAGSLAKANMNSTTTAAQNPEIKMRQQPDADTVNFRGNGDGKKKTSVVKTLFKLATTAALVIGGLGYAHKAGWVEKLGEGKLKDIANKITEPCHNLCSKVKGYGEKALETVKGWFNKK